MQLKFGNASHACIRLDTIVLRYNLFYLVAITVAHYEPTCVTIHIMRTNYQSVTTQFIPNRHLSVLLQAISSKRWLLAGCNAQQVL